MLIDPCRDCKKDRWLADRALTVGHIVYAFKNGGIERGLLNLINYGDSQAFRHVIICLTEAGAFAERLGSPTSSVVELRKSAGNDFRLPTRIAATARKYGIDILHARGWPAMVETALAARLAGVRATIYGFHGRGLNELRGLPARRRWAQRFVIRWYDRVITLNSQMQSELASECGLSKDRIQIIANGVDVESFRPCDDGSTLRARFGLPTDQIIIGNVARLDPVKNHEVILRALRLLVNRGLKVFLLLVGEGPHRNALQGEVERLQLASYVRLFGYSNYIPELLNCLDLYVQSSFYEGFSNTVLEAMASGLPVLATDVGGTRDLLNHSQEGFFFNSNDEETLASLITRLLYDKEQRHVLGKRARKHVVQRFPVETMVRNYENLYLHLGRLGQRHKGREA